MTEEVRFLRKILTTTHSTLNKRELRETFTKDWSVLGDIHSACFVRLQELTKATDEDLQKFMVE